MIWPQILKQKGRPIAVYTFSVKLLLLDFIQTCY